MRLEKAFLTGSRVYGVPAEDSDVDLVVLGSYPLIRHLIPFADNGEKVKKALKSGTRSPDDSGASMYFGRLNLIIETSRRNFTQWLVGTEILIEEQERGEPVSRDRAVEVFEQVRADPLLAMDTGSGETCPQCPACGCGAMRDFTVFHWCGECGCLRLSEYAHHVPDRIRGWGLDDI